MRPRPVATDQAREFLAGRFDAVDELAPLGGGFWSSAFFFRHAGRELVIRFGASGDWFEADRAAMAFASPGLPVPEVIEVGQAFGGAYAISQRHHGIYLEDVKPEQAHRSGPMLASLLEALYRVPKSPDLAVGWYWRPPRAELTWRDWLLEGLVDDPRQQTHGWRAVLAELPDVDRVFRAADSRIRQLVAACPERRDLVHGDLLHANVLVTADASRPTAVYSWKCSLRGDFLFDVAWCSFWARWHPGIAAADPWFRLRQAPALRDDPEAWVDASVRRHCYELHIGATHLGWNIWVGDHQTLREVADHLAEVLDGGPHSPGH